MNKKALFTIIAVLILATSCFSPYSGQDAGMGRFSISVGSSSTSRVSWNGYETSSFTHVITLSNGSSTNKSTTIRPGEPQTAHFTVEPGVWTISVEGRTPNGEVVSVGSVTKSITAGTNGTIGIKMGPPEETDGDFLYTVSSGEVTITGYTGPGGNVSIPSTIDGFTVTTIGYQAFVSKGLTGVTIPNSVTEIGQYAFYGNQLTSLTIGNSVIDIGDYSFRGNQLTSVTIPNSVTSIGQQAFHSNQLTSLTIGNSVTSIGQLAFVDNQLISVIFPDSVTNIGRDVFAGTNQLTITSVTIGANVQLASPATSATNTGFEDAYNTTYGKQAGTYTRPDTDTTTWTHTP